MNKTRKRPDNQPDGGRIIDGGSFLQPPLFIIAFGLLYYDSIIFNISKWSTYEGSHWPLILLVSCYLVWLKRHDFRSLSLQPAIFVGTLLTGTGCFMLFAGELSNTITVKHISVIPTLLGAILLLRGWAYLKLLFIPVVYLIFMTGLIEVLLSDVAIYFQLVSAWLAAQMLELTGMPVLLAGTIIELPHVALEVIEACSGINHIVSLMALAVPLAVMSQLSMVKKFILVIASFFIGILANGTRITIIGVYTLFNKDVDIHGPSGIFTMSFVFFLGMFVLIILSQLLKKKKGTTPGFKGTIEKTKDNSTDTDSNKCGVLGKASDDGGRKPVIALTIAGIILLLTLGCIHFYTIKPQQLPRSFNQFPVTIADYTSEELPHIDQRLRPFAADEELMRSYSDTSGNRVEVYIGYFEEQSPGRKLIDYRRSWMYQGAQPIAIAAAENSVVINRIRQSSDQADQVDVYFWYMMDDRIITSKYAGKFYTFIDGLLKRRTNGAVVIVEAHSDLEEVRPFLRETLGVLQKWPKL